MTTILDIGLNSIFADAAVLGWEAANPEVVHRVLAAPVDGPYRSGGEGRSQWFWLRTDHGQIMLACLPQCATLNAVEASMDGAEIPRPEPEVTAGLIIDDLPSLAPLAERRAQDIWDFRRRMNEWWFDHREQVLAAVPDGDRVNLFFAQLRQLLVGLTISDWQIIDASVDQYTYGWFIRRWRNTAYDGSLFRSNS